VRDWEILELGKWEIDFKQQFYINDQFPIFPIPKFPNIPIA